MDEDELLDLNDLAFHKDLKILALKIAEVQDEKKAGTYVSEKDMDGFYSRSKMFFKEPLSREMGADYCWKRTHNRCGGGLCVGQIPKACPGGTKKGEMASWLPICYKEGKALQDCKAGWRDDFLYCRKPEYGRGVGHFTKRGCLKNKLTLELPSFGAKADCRRPRSSPLIYYPDCKPGYDNFGCCICRPLGVTSETCKEEYGANSHRFAGSSCYKSIDWSKLKPHYANCQNHKDGTPMELDAGLCYKPCNEGFTGVGPVCWEQAKDEAVSCGMGIAKDKTTCSGVTSDQVFSVAKAALNLATFGGAGPVVAAVTKTVETVEIAYATCNDLLSQTEEFDAAGAIDISTRLLMGKTYLGGLKEMSEAETAADGIRGAAKFAAQFDPTGAAQIIGAFTYEKCPTKSGLER
jgi:hypothetical protein